MIPELRTSPRFAIVLAISAVVAIGVAVLGSDQVETALGSGTATAVLLGAWCVSAATAAIAAIVDAFIRPEGETLALATTIAATVFGILAMVALVSVTLGAMDVLT